MNIIEYENYHEQHETFSDGFPYLTYPCSIPCDFAEVPLHWHDEMEIIYIKKGTGLVIVDQVRLMVCAGDLVFLCPGQLHAIRQSHQESMEYENIIFSPLLLKGTQADTCWDTFLSPILLKETSLPVLITPDTEHYTELSVCIDQIDELRRSFPEGYPLFIKGKLFELFSLFYQYGMVTPCAAVTKSRLKSREKAKQILKYIEQHYTEPITIQTIAEAVGFSPSHFMKFFKQTFGMSFIGYLNTHRLVIAARLLVSSDDTILSIAVETGFENLSYFNRMFKKKFGITPRQYRQRNRL